MTPWKRILGSVVLALVGLGVLAPNTAAQLSRVLASNVVGTFSSVTVKVGTGTATATPAGLLFAATTATSTTDLIEDVLLSYPMPANTLTATGRGIRITAAGNFAANANVKNARLYFGAASLTTGAINGSPNALAFQYVWHIFRTGATAQTASILLNMGTGASIPYTNVTTPSETFASPILIKLTGLGATTIGDVTATLLTVEAL